MSCSCVSHPPNPDSYMDRALLLALIHRKCVSSPLSFSKPKPNAISWPEHVVALTFHQHHLWCSRRGTAFYGFCSRALPLRHRPCSIVLAIELAVVPASADGSNVAIAVVIQCFHTQIYRNTLDQTYRALTWQPRFLRFLQCTDSYRTSQDPVASQPCSLRLP